MENETRKSKYSVSKSTERYLDSLNTLSNFYAEIGDAIELSYGELQVDRILDTEIYSHYSALRDAVKNIMLDVMEDNLGNKDSTTI